LRRLTGADEERAKRLDERIAKAMKAGRWEEAISGAEELLALRSRVLGAGHFEVVDAEWRIKALRRGAAAPPGAPAAYPAASEKEQQAESFYERGKYAEAQPLYEEVLAIRRRLLSDDHPETALSYINVAFNLDEQARYAQAQPLYERALDIRRRLLTED